MAIEQLEMTPLQWADLKKLGDVEPLNDADLECMAEVREVLKKHGKRDRFGLALLHKHFDMNEGEVLLENTDKGARELNIKPIQRAAAKNSVPTIWKLLDHEIRSVQECRKPDPQEDESCMY